MRTKPTMAALAVAALASWGGTATAAELGYHPYAGNADIAGPWSAEGFLGNGIGTGEYGLAYGGRLGYGAPNSVYLGGEATRYDMGGGASELLVGGDLGYRAFLTRALELRPFSLVGAALRGGGSSNQFAVQPGLLAAYHLGSAFLSAEGRYQALPAPTGASLLAGAGLSF